MKDKIISILNRSEIQAGLSTASAGGAIADPVIGAIITAVKDVVSVADEVRARRIFKGLASGLNQETHMNELVNFIAASDQNALFIANPDDVYAAEHENGSLGKMECWYILVSRMRPSLSVIMRRHVRNCRI